MNEPWEKSEQTRSLWRQWSDAGAEPAAADAEDGIVCDELTLAAYAEGRLTPAEMALVETLLETRPELEADVAAARDAGVALDAAGIETPASAGLSADLSGDLSGVIARASALVPASGDRIIAFRPKARPEPTWRFAARWGALAASFLMVSYLGFALGSDASSTVSLLTQAGSGFADELLDPPSGLFGGLAEASGA